MNKLQKVFNYNENQSRTVTVDGEPWFVAEDVCNVLELEQMYRDIAALDDDEKNTHRGN